MRKVGLLLLLVFTLALASACGTSSSAKPYTDMRIVTRASLKVGATYGESAPQIVRTTALIADGDPKPMNLVWLDGHFHKGTLSAQHLSFSMLSDGSSIWAIRAFDDSNTEVWIDHTLTP